MGGKCYQKSHDQEDTPSPDMWSPGHSDPQKDMNYDKVIKNIQELNILAREGSSKVTRNSQRATLKVSYIHIRYVIYIARLANCPVWLLTSICSAFILVRCMCSGACGPVHVIRCMWSGACGLVHVVRYISVCSIHCQHVCSNCKDTLA